MSKAFKESSNIPGQKVYFVYQRKKEIKML